MMKFKKPNVGSPKSGIKQLNKTHAKNVGMLSFIGTTTLACNASQDDQCYGGLGVFVGSFCASQNDPVVTTQVKLDKITTTDDFILSIELDPDGNRNSDTVELINKNDVIGTKYTLTDGDIVKNAGTVFLNFINSGSIDGQKIFNSDEIEISTQGTTVILASDWYNNDVITVKGSDQSVTLNDLQASKLDSARASDNMFYPNTSYKVEDVNAPNQSIKFYFNDAAILGTSTEVDILIKDSTVGIEAGVFVNPDAGDAVNADEEVDPFLVEADTNIEKLNLKIADTDSLGSKILDLVYAGLETLELSGGTETYKFEISSPLEASLIEINARTVPADLVLNVSESNLSKQIILGPGNDLLTVGNSLVESPSTDSIDGGDGLDKILVTFEDAITTAPNLSSIEALDLSSNGDSILDFSNVSGLETVNILASTAGISLTNIPFDLIKFNVGGSQTGAWSFSHEDNADSVINLNWSNDTGGNVAITSLTFDEVQSLSFNLNGESDVSLAALVLDPNDTKYMSITNTGDGNLTISPANQLGSLDAVTSVSLTAIEGGNISLGSASENFGISNAAKLTTINLVASKTGNVELGSIGSNREIEDLQSISVTSSGGDVNLGSIAASKSGTFTAAISSSATLSVGDLDFENAGISFVASGSGILNPITFTNEAYSTINVTDLVSNVNVSFSNANTGVIVLLGSGDDNITLGLGSDTVTGNDGADTFVINNGSSGVSMAAADTIIDFQPNVDKLKLGFAGDGSAGTGNYVESDSSVENYSEALLAANSALATLNGSSAGEELYAFEFDSNSGYLFIDNNSDGVAEDLIILSGIESSLISASDIVV